MSGGGRIHFQRGHPRAGPRSLFPRVFARRDGRALLVVLGQGMTQRECGRAGEWKTRD